MKFLDFLSDKTGVFAAIAAIMLALLGTADVLFVQLFNAPIVGMIEFSSMLLVCVVFLGMAGAVRQDDNISVDFLLNALSGTPRKILILFNSACTLLFFVILSYLCWRLALESFEKGDVLAGAINFRLWPFKLIAALGASLSLVALFVRLVGSWTKPETNQN